MINLGNYEEYFILYMDNELSADEKLMVEAFLSQHPHLQEELDMLMGTKLPLDALCFDGKEDLFSSSMKINTVDESLLLYIDNELSLGEKSAVAEKIVSDKNYAAQHAALLQTKLDANEKILHPNKKELYRHTERVIAFRGWMRIAAAVVLLLFGSLFFVLNKKGNTVIDNSVAVKPTKEVKPVTTEKNNPAEKLIEKVLPSNEEKSVAQTKNKTQPAIENTGVADRNKANGNDNNLLPTEKNVLTAKQQPRQREIIQFDVNRFTNAPQIDENAIAINNPITHNTVTSPITASYNSSEDTQEPADPSGDFKNTKKSSAKGLFRKVTRFIGRNTGIGTADKDADEVLIGAVALKLK